MVEQSPQLSSVVKLFRKAIVYEKTASSYKPLSRETKNKDGLSPHCAICDEMHAWTDDRLYHLITTGMGARRQPLIFSITTAGADMSLPYYSMRSFYIDILRGVKKQENTFAIIFCPDKDDDWKDRRTWEKANPNYGVSVYEHYMETEFESAMNKGGTKEVEFKTKNLNIWVDAPDVWIQDEKVRQCDFGTTDEDLLGRECYGGLDLASHVDITALTLYFPTLDTPAVRMWVWIPEGKVLQKQDRVDYREWHRQGWVNITPGDVIDIDYLTRDIDRILKDYDVKRVAFDPAKAYHGVIQNLQKNGYDEILDEFSQSMMNMSEPTKKVEADVTAGAVDLMRNPVLRWMFRNVAIYRDANDNIKLDKKRSAEKIDGVVAMANAYGTYMSVKEDESYEYHGFYSCKI
jgi:phage terminase large subunit-like protein